MISSNLIKLDNESMTEIRVFFERKLLDDSMQSKIIKFDFDFVEKLKIEERSIFRKSEDRNLRK